mgnify:CR=1 FL=1
MAVTEPSITSPNQAPVSLAGGRLRVAPPGAAQTALCPRWDHRSPATRATSTSCRMADAASEFS